MFNSDGRMLTLAGTEHDPVLPPVITSDGFWVPESERVDWHPTTDEEYRRYLDFYENEED